MKFTEMKKGDRIQILSDGSLMKLEVTSDPVLDEEIGSWWVSCLREDGLEINFFGNSDTEVELAQ